MRREGRVELEEQDRTHQDQRVLGEASKTRYESGSLGEPGTHGGDSGEQVCAYREYRECRDCRGCRECVTMCMGWSDRPKIQPQSHAMLASCGYQAPGV